MPIRIIAATTSDVDTIVRLNGVVQDHHVRLRPDFFRADWDVAALRDLWRARLGEEAGRVALAMLDGTPAGSIWFEIEERPADALRHAERRIYIHHLAVEASARRRGVGSALLRHAETEAARLGIAEVLLHVWAANAVARSFYAAQGYVPRNMVLARVAAG